MRFEALKQLKNDLLKGPQGRKVSQKKESFFTTRKHLSLTEHFRAKKVMAILRFLISRFFFSLFGSGQLTKNFHKFKIVKWP